MGHDLQELQTLQERLGMSLAHDRAAFAQPPRQNGGPFLALGGRGGLRVAGFNEINTPADDDDDEEDDDEEENYDYEDDFEDNDEDFADDFDAIDAQDPGFRVQGDSDSDSDSSNSNVGAPAELFVRGRALSGVDSMWQTLNEMQAAATAASNTKRSSENTSAPPPWVTIILQSMGEV
jgi:hypothetical protein